LRNKKVPLLTEGNISRLLCNWDTSQEPFLAVHMLKKAIKEVLLAGCNWDCKSNVAGRLMRFCDDEISPMIDFDRMTSLLVDYFDGLARDKYVRVLFLLVSFAAVIRVVTQ